VAAWALGKDRVFGRWVAANVRAHRQAGYSIAMISLKARGKPPGDATSEQMELIADLADRWSFGEIVVTHEQNLVLPHVETDALPELHARLLAAELAEPNIGHVTDIIACPGLDYCSLANARSIPVAQELSTRFRNPDISRDLGRLHINISGCINACGHHHVGHIGLLGVEKNGKEFYQITVGGRADEHARLGTLLGPAVGSAEVADAVEDIVEAYLELRARPDEIFLDTLARIGLEPFKERVYATR
jgi:sulfite reductase (NADPH) hemoprotein beta-component